MNKELLRQKTVDAVYEELVGYQNGLYVTLNTIHHDKVKFEEQLNKINYWIQDYCYGKSFTCGLKRLRVVAMTEIGNLNQGLHAHVLIMFNDDMVKPFEGLKTFITRKWYSLIGARCGVRGNLVNVQPIGNLYSRVQYSLKTFYHNQQELNPLYL